MKNYRYRNTDIWFTKSLRSSTKPYKFDLRTLLDHKPAEICDEICQCGFRQQNEHRCDWNDSGGDGKCSVNHGYPAVLITHRYVIASVQ